MINNTAQTTSPPTAPTTTDRVPMRALSEPYAFALLQWPALLGVLSLEGDGFAWLVLRIALGAVAALAIIGAYTGHRGLGFGNAMLACCGCVAAAWWTWPTPWSLAWLALLALLMLAAQGLRLRDLAADKRRPATT
ncbi:hypothetical protein [Piscinibacter sakaiensis]|uniref:hypothetical protein n=1 Tax=Piscinibacter sakaiensis TaxID=1547922 RepID=UPI003AAC3630